MSRLTAVQIPTETQHLDSETFAQFSLEAMASRLMGLHELRKHLKQQYMIKVEAEEAEGLKAEIQELRNRILVFDRILKERVEREQAGKVGELGQCDVEEEDEVQDDEPTVQKQDEVEEEVGDVKEHDGVKEEAGDVKVYDGLKEVDELEDEEGDMKEDEMKHEEADVQGEAGEAFDKQADVQEGDEVKDDEPNVEEGEAEVKDKEQSVKTAGMESEHHSHAVGCKDVSAPTVYPPVTSNSSDQGEDQYLHPLRRSRRRNYFILAFLLIPMFVCFLGLSVISIPTTSTHPLRRLHQHQHRAPGLLVSESYPNTSTPLPVVHESLEGLVTQLRQAQFLPSADDGDLMLQIQPLQLPPQLKKMLVQASERLAEHAQPELPLEHRLMQCVLRFAEAEKSLPSFPVRDTGCPLLCYVLRWRRVCLGCLSMPTRISLPDRIAAEGEAARVEFEQRAVSAGLIRALLQKEVLAGAGVDGVLWAKGGEAVVRDIQLAASKVEQCALAAMGEVDEVVRNVAEWASGESRVGL